MAVTGSTRGTTGTLLPLVLALLAAASSSSGAAAPPRPVAAAAAAASTATSSPPPAPPAPRPRQASLHHVFGAGTAAPVTGRHRSASPSSATSAAARDGSVGRILSSSASRPNSESIDEEESHGRRRERPTVARWMRRARRRSCASGPRSRASRRFLPAAGLLGFVTSPATPPLGKQRQTRPQSCCGSISSSSSSSTSVAAGGFTGAQYGAGAWGGGGAWSAGSGRRQQPPPWGGGRRRGGGDRSSDAVVVAGGTGDTEFYSWTETDSDIEVRVSLPPGTRAKSVQLSVTKTAVTLGLKGREGPVLKGSLKGKVHADESHWTMEEMEDTGEKVLYLCLEKAVDMEALAENTMPGDWEGVLEGEEPLNLYYPDKDKDFDVDEYVKRMGYDRERDIDKVDKTMFSDLTANMKQNLETTLPKSAFTDKDDMIPVMADPKVSPVIDTGVLGLPTPPPREPKIAADAIVDVVAAEDGGEAAVDAEVMRDESWAAGFAPDLGGADDGEGSRGVGSGGGYSPAGFRADAEFDVRVTGPEEGGGAGELTARQREVSAGLRNTYEKLVKRGMINETNPDGTPAKIPDMDEMARSYETEGFMFKDGDFTEEELSKYMDMDMGMGAGMGMDADLPGGEIDLSDPEVRAAFGLE